MHRHEGGLRGRRLRRVHGRRRRTERRGRRRVQGGQRVHPVPADARWPRAVHRRGPAPAGRRAASGAGGARRMPRLAMRLLHAGLCDVDVGAVRAARARSAARRSHDAVARADRRRAHRQSVPLHRLPSDRRRGGAHVRRAAAEGARRRRRARARAAGAAPGRHVPLRARGPGVRRAAHARRARAAEGREARRARARGQHRRRPMGDEATARSGRRAVRRPGARAAPDRRARRLDRDRRGRVGRGCVCGARRALSGARRDVEALRLAADPQRGDDRRQRRERLADRRFDAGPDRARRAGGAARRPRGAASCRSRICTSAIRRRTWPSTSSSSR